MCRIVEKGKNIRDIAIIKLLLNTGLRVSELCDLTWINIKISPKKGHLKVNHGKGSKRREVPLNKDARKALQDLGYNQHKGSLENVFIGQRGAMTPRGVESMLKKYVLHTDLEAISPHQLRHTFCKNLIDAGVSLEKVADERRSRKFRNYQTLLYSKYPRLRSGGRTNWGGGLNL